MVDCFLWFYIGYEVDKVVGIELCGFLFVFLVVLFFNVGFVLVCKLGKFFGLMYEVSYEFEYGFDMLQLYEGVIEFGEKVLVVDDLFVIGGMVCVMIDFCEKFGGEVVGCGFIVELMFFGGCEVLLLYLVFVLLQYDEQRSG